MPTKIAEPTTTVVAAASNSNSNSNESTKHTQPQTQTQTHQQPSSSSPTTTTPTTTTTTTSDDGGVDAVEFRDTAKVVVLLVIERLIRALDYERESLIPLAIKLHNSASPAALANEAAIEQFIRTSYAVPSTVAQAFDTTPDTAAITTNSNTTTIPPPSASSLRIAADDDGC